MNTCQNITAFSGGSGSTVTGCAMSIINSVIPVVVAITVLWIIWGAFNLTKSEGADRNKWRDVILYGIVGLFVMISIYGFVNLLSGTFSFGGNNTINVPNISNSIKSP